MATNDKHWRDMYEKFADPALDNTLRIVAPDRSKYLGRMPCYSLYQANCSLEVLLGCEKGNALRRAKIERAMKAFSELAAGKARNAMKNPDAKPPYGMCWDGELLLTMFMTPGVPDADAAAPFLEQAVGRSDLSKSGIIRASHVMAAYWRSRVLAAKEAK